MLVVYLLSSLYVAGWAFIWMTGSWVTRVVKAGAVGLFWPIFACYTFLRLIIFLRKTPLEK